MGDSVTLFKDSHPVTAVTGRHKLLKPLPRPLQPLPAAKRYIRSGRPFIVTDMVEGWGMRDWDCESVRQDFGDEEMHLWNAYGDSSQPAVVRLSDPWQQWLFPQEGSLGAGGGREVGRREVGAPSAGEVLIVVMARVGFVAGLHREEPPTMCCPSGPGGVHASFLMA